MKHQLSVGFVVDNSGCVPVWYYETIEKTVQAGFKICFLVAESGTSVLRAPLGYSLFQKFEEKWFQSGDDALLPKSITHWQSEANTVSISSNEGKEAGEASLRSSLSCDIIYTIEQDITQLSWLSERATYGLWQLRFGQHGNGRKNLPAFWEVMTVSAVTGSSLLIHKQGKIYSAYEGTTRTVPYSVKNNFNSIAWKSSSYLPLRLLSLDWQPDSFLKDLPSISSMPNKKQYPANLAMAYLFAKNVVGYLGYKLAGLRAEKRFTLLYCFTKFTLEDLPKIQFTPLALPSKDVFYADPFLIQRDGRHYVFFEEMVYSKGKAHIALITVDSDGVVSSPVTVLETSYHLSYPFVFEHGGEFYMIPESASNQTVSLYKAAPFPTNWEFVMHLMENVVLFDATLHYRDGLWWLFANGSNHPFVSTNDQLFAFYSNDLLSASWTPHPFNPVATHAANCRPAGRLFSLENKLYRPAQNNASQQYGYGLKINEVEMLTTTAYQEKEVQSIVPETLGLIASHHIDFSNSVVVIDGIPK